MISAASAYADFGQWPGAEPVPEICTGRISQPLMHGLSLAFYIAAGMSFVAAIASLLRGHQVYARPASQLGPNAAGRPIAQR